MKQTIKVTLLSVLVFPGVGHLVLKKYPIALAFIASASYLLFGIISEVIDKTQMIVDSVLRGDIPMEATAIRQALFDQQVLAGQNQTFVMYLLVLIWAIAAFDAYRLANKNSQTNSTNPK